MSSNCYAASKNGCKTLVDKIKGLQYFSAVWGFLNLEDRNLLILATNHPWQIFNTKLWALSGSFPESKGNLLKCPMRCRSRCKEELCSFGRCGWDQKLTIFWDCILRCKVGWSFRHTQQHLLCIIRAI